MRNFEEKFLEWVESILQDRFPARQCELIRNDLWGAFKDGNENFINSKLKLFEKTMQHACSKDPKFLKEITDQITSFKNVFESRRKTEGELAKFKM